jgi:hypothetical protein
MLTIQRLVVSLLALALVSGCSSSATLTLRNGREVSGTVAKSTADAVWLETDQEIEPEQANAALGAEVVIVRSVESDVAGVLSTRTRVRRSEDGGGMEWDRVCVELAPCVAGDDVSAVERRVRVQRADIADVSHPGLAAVLLGGPLAAVGVALMVSGARQGAFADKQSDECGEDRCSNLPTDADIEAGFGLLLALPGIGLLSYGAMTNVASSDNFAPPASAALSPKHGARGIRLGFEF